MHTLRIYRVILAEVEGIIDIKGCTTRRDYWLATLCGVVVGGLVTLNQIIYEALWGESLHDVGNILYFYAGQISLILFMWIDALASITMSVRRLHDVGKNGWWRLLCLIPLIGWIVLIVFLCEESKLENNPYRQES